MQSLNNNVTHAGGGSSPASLAAGDLTPKTLVLDLLAVSGDVALTSPALTSAGQLMGFSAGAVRVAVSRLAAEGLIESPSRGEWKIVPSTPWAREQARWQNLEGLVKPWTGEWWVVVTNQVPRSERAAWHRHERALMHRGLREAARDVFVRPVNLSLSLEALRDELAQLGLHPESLLFEVSQMSFQPDAALWQCEERHRALSGILEAMQAVMQERAASDVETDELCRRFLLTGRDAARVLNTDPLLPEEWTGSALRVEVASAMPRFVAAGRAVWLKRLGVRD